MATWEDMPLNNKQFDKVLQQFAKALVLASNNLTAAIHRNTAAVRAQTVELIKAQKGP